MSNTSWAHNVKGSCFCLILSLSGNRISDVGASVFGEALKVNKSLKQLE